MKKISLYTDTPQVGGAELQIFLLAKFLDKSEFEPILICSNYPQLNKWCTKFEKEEIRVIRLNVKHKHDPRHFFQLKKILKDEHIDILHLHIWNPASCRYAFSAAANLNIPLVTTEHDPFQLSGFKDFFKKRSLRKVQKIITVSQNNAKLLKELYPDASKKIEVIHNGIDVSWWQSQLLRFDQKDRKEVKIGLFAAKEDTLIITNIAELHERKGQEYLIKAMPEVIARYPNIKLILVGEGPDKSRLSSLIKKLELNRHIALLGRQKEIPKILKSSDIFCLPSRREAFGLVNAEAMITGLPVIASRVGGVPEIVQDGETGILVKAESSEELSKAITELIASSQKRQDLGQAGKARIEKSFDAKKMSLEYEKIYKSS